MNILQSGFFPLKKYPQGFLCGEIIKPGYIVRLSNGKNITVEDTGGVYPSDYIISDGLSYSREYIYEIVDRPFPYFCDWSGWLRKLI
jgi:hypothetical protein